MSSESRKNLSDIATQVSYQLGSKVISKKTSNDVLKLAFEIMLDYLYQGQDISIRNFGTFIPSRSKVPKNFSKKMKNGKKIDSKFEYFNFKFRKSKTILQKYNAYDPHFGRKRKI